MDNLSLFVDTLQELLISRNITPNDLHNSTKLSTNVIYAWLRKQGMPTLDSLVILADFFNCSMEYLCGRNGQVAFVKSATPSTLAERLRLLMTNKGISRRTLSSQTKISMCGIQRFLTGTGKPLLNNLIILSNYFGCTLDFLVGRES